MKKVLFASTALVATAGVAAADVSLSGSADMGLSYNGTSTVVVNDIDINVVWLCFYRWWPDTGRIRRLGRIFQQLRAHHWWWCF